jgi:hypothetical protein
MGGRSDVEMKYTKVLRELGLEASKFLKENGGMLNGFETYIEGDVAVGTYGSLEWCTPDRQNLTYKQAQEKGTDLNRRLRAVLDNNLVDRCMLTSRSTEHGCWLTFISITEGLEVKL